MHIWSWVLPPGASGSCMVCCSHWQDSLPSPCGRTDVWASGTNPGATSGCLVAGGGVLVPGEALVAFLCPTHPRQLDHKHTYVHPDGKDCCPTSPATYSNTDAYALSLTAHMLYQMCSITQTHSHRHRSTRSRAHTPGLQFAAMASSHSQGASPVAHA